VRRLPRFFLVTAILTAAAAVAGIGLSLVLPAIGVSRPWSDSVAIAAMVATILIFTLVLDRALPRR